MLHVLAYLSQGHIVGLAYGFHMCKPAPRRRAFNASRAVSSRQDASRPCSHALRSCVR